MNSNPFIDKAKEYAKQEAIINKRKWLCMCPNCNKVAINSHLLQRNGILNHITCDGHLYEVRLEDFFKWEKNNPVTFRKVGIMQAISFPLFCSDHDTNIFKRIEGGKIDFDDYIGQLLFSYRALCAEIFKKQCNLIRQEIWSVDIIKQKSIEGTDRALNDLKYYKYLFESEIKHPQKKFTFYHHSYPFIGICASGTCSYEPVDYNSSYSIDSVNNKKVWDGFFINIIPQKESLEILLGFHNNHVNREMRNYVESWKGLSFVNLQKKLTDLFCVRLETWSMSPDVYKSLSEEKKRWFIEKQKMAMLDLYYDIRNEITGNLFE